MAESRLTTVVDIQVKNSDAINALFKYNVALQEVAGELDNLKKVKKEEGALSVEQQKQVIMLTEKQKALKKEMGEMSRQVQNNIIAEGKYKDTLKGLGAQLSVAKDTLRSMEMGTIKYGKALEEAREQLAKMERGTDAYAKQEKAVKKLQSQMDRANEAYKEQEAYVKSLNDTMKESEEAYGVFTRNVGNYKESAEMLRNELEGMREGIDGLRTGLDTVSQIMVLTGTESEGLNKAVKAVTIGFTAFDAVSKVVNAAMKTNIATKAALTLQTKAATVSQNLETIAVSGGTVAKKAATVAQLALNAAMKANPIVLVTTALLAAGAAILAFAKKSGEATEEQERQREATKKQMEAIKEFNDSIAQGAAANITQYELLRRAYTELRTEHEKRDWIKKNASEIESLGFAVESVAEAENLFVRNTGNVVQSFKLRAEAAAYQAKMEEAYARKINTKLAFEQRYPLGSTPPEYILNAYRKEMTAISDEIDKYANRIANLTQQANNLTGGIRRSGGRTSYATSSTTSSTSTTTSTTATSESATSTASEVPFISPKDFEFVGLTPEDFAEERELYQLRIDAAEEGSIAEWEARKELLLSQQMEEILLATRTDEELELLKAKHIKEMEALDKEYADKQREIDKQTFENKMAIANATLGGLKAVFDALGEDNKDFAKLSKGIALAQVAVDTGVAISKGVASAMGTPFPGNLAAIATTITTVMSNIATAISTIKSAKFARGGYVSGPGTATSDDIPARLSNGESINTALSTSMFGPMLSAFNVMGGGVPIVAQTSAQIAGEEMLARAVAKGVAKMQPVVSVSEINRVNNRVRVVSNLGNV